MLTSPLRGLVAVVCFSFLVAACGDDDDTSSTTDAGIADAGSDAVGADTGDGVDAGPDDAEPDSAADVATGPPPTLTMIHDEIFMPTCGESSCHTMGGNAAGLNLDNDGELHARLLASSSIRGLPHITPNDLSLSYLYLKSSGEHLDVAGGRGSRMPLGRAPLTQAQLQMLADWINDGAPDN